jgi:hypothetical protein
VVEDDRTQPSLGLGRHGGGQLVLLRGVPTFAKEVQVLILRDPPEPERSQDGDRGSVVRSLHRHPTQLVEPFVSPGREQCHGRVGEDLVQEFVQPRDLHQQLKVRRLGQARRLGHERHNLLERDRSL